MPLSDTAKALIADLDAKFKAGDIDRAELIVRTRNIKKDKNWDEAKIQRKIAARRGAKSGFEALKDLVT